MALPGATLVTGNRGELRAGYQQAAVLGRWQVTLSQSVLGKLKVEFSGKVGAVDDYWSNHEALDLWLYMGGRTWWIWRKVDLFDNLRSGASIEIRTEGNFEIREA